MTDLARLKQEIAALSEPDQRLLHAYVRRLLPPHEMEIRLKADAEMLLDALARSNDLTIRGVEGVLAEASFAREYAPTIAGLLVQDGPTGPSSSYDFLVAEDATAAPLRLQIKMQRRENHQPLMANSKYKSRKWPSDYYVVETQRTRSGKKGTGEKTRPYKFSEFDLLGVSLGASRGRWSIFTFTVAAWLLPAKDPVSLLTFQPVSPRDDGDWHSDLRTVIAWARSGKKKRIQG